MPNDEHVALLKQGVAAWNAWRNENPNIPPNLKDAHLGGADLTWRGVPEFSQWPSEFANLREADLSGADLIRANLAGADLTGANLRDATLMMTYLRRANFVRAGPQGGGPRQSGPEPGYEETIRSSNTQGWPKLTTYPQEMPSPSHLPLAYKSTRV
jgi:hypothetical protein